MPFGLVSAWNKRRRSKSQDHTDPCMFIAASCSFNLLVVSWFEYVSTFFSGVYKPVELWQLEDQTPHTTKRHHGSSVFTLKEMEEATCSFSDEQMLGKGGFGRVYRGTLRSGEVCPSNAFSFTATKTQNTTNG